MVHVLKRTQNYVLPLIYDENFTIFLHQFLIKYSHLVMK